jgi:cell division transport system permease protein
MRLLKILVVAVFAVVAMAGCGLSEPTPEAKTLDDAATFTVYLNDDVTEQQRLDVRAWLVRQPGVIAVSFEDKATAHEKAKELWSDDPEFAKSMNKASLSDTFRLNLKDMAAVREIRDGAANDELEALPGVRQVVYPCTTNTECQNLIFSPSPRPSY